MAELPGIGAGKPATEMELRSGLSARGYLKPLIQGTVGTMLFKQGPPSGNSRETLSLLLQEEQLGSMQQKSGGLETLNGTTRQREKRSVTGQVSMECCQRPGR